MQLDTMGAGVNPYTMIVADYLKPPFYFGDVYLHVPLFVVMLLHRSTVIVLTLAIIILSHAELTLLFHLL